MDLISRASKSRDVDRFVFFTLVFGTVAASVIYCVVTGVVTDYRALMPTVVIPTLAVYFLYDPARVLIRWVRGAFASKESD